MSKPLFKKLLIHTDSRGKLVEIIRPEDVGKESFGQILITTAKKNETKGGHYHLRKTEWYCVIRGRASLELKNIKTGEVRNQELSDTNMQLVMIPPFWHHSIKNTGGTEMILLVYCNEPFESTDPDTYYEKK